MGATTTWEFFDCIAPDGSLGSDACDLDAVDLGSVGEWMYANAGGIAQGPTSSGYKEPVIWPRPGGGLTHASQTLHTTHGDLKVAWQKQTGCYTLDADVPVNTTALVHVQGTAPTQISETGQGNAIRPAQKATGVSLVGVEQSTTVFRVGSGHYQFSTC
jgi:hypothetical protein